MTTQAFSGIHIALWDDVVELCRRRLTTADYILVATDAPDDIVLKYLNVRHRRIRMRPRRLLLSSRLTPRGKEWQRAGQGYAAGSILGTKAGSRCLTERRAGSKLSSNV